jgi:hypothetical protein
MCFFNSSEQAYLKQTEPISTLKTMTCKMYSFQNLSQFSQGNNVLHTPVCNIDGFLYRDTCVSSTDLNRPIWSKQILSPPKVAGSIPFTK